MQEQLGATTRKVNEVAEVVKPIPALIKQVEVNTKRLDTLEASGSPGLQAHEAEDNRRIADLTRRADESDGRALRISDKLDAISLSLSDIKADLKILRTQLDDHKMQTEKQRMP